MIVMFFCFSKEQRQGGKKTHKDDNYVLSLCLRVVGREGEEKTIIFRHCLLFFTRAMMRRKLMT
jgi:hypothetical protein